MAKETGKGTRKNARRPALPKYFFLEDQLYRILHIVRSQDLLKAWNYPEKKVQQFNYSTVLRRHEKAFTTTQVAKMLNRSVKRIEFALADGMIPRPQKTARQYYWSEKDIMGLHDFFASVHIGRPRKDGQVTNNSLPTRREVRAIIHDEAILYVKQGDQFVPTWRAKEF